MKMNKRISVHLNLFLFKFLSLFFEFISKQGGGSEIFANEGRQGGIRADGGIRAQTTEKVPFFRLNVPTANTKA